MPKPGFHKRYAVFSTRYGSIDNRFRRPDRLGVIEAPDGIAHFLEHQLFEDESGHVFNAFADLGTSVNAYTSHTMTSYLFSTTDNFAQALDRLLDFVQAPHFTDAGVEKEIGIIEQEIQMYQDQPRHRLMMNLLQALYHVHPVRIDIAGTPESIRAITAETLYTCYDTFYHPSNMAVFVVGDVDPDAVLDQVVDDIAARDYAFRAPVERLFDEEPETPAETRVETAMAAARPLYAVGFKDVAALAGPPKPHREHGRGAAQGSDDVAGAVGGAGPQFGAVPGTVRGRPHRRRLRQPAPSGRQLRPHRHGRRNPGSGTIATRDLWTASSGCARKACPRARSGGPGARRWASSCSSLIRWSSSPTASCFTTSKMRRCLSTCEMLEQVTPDEVNARLARAPAARHRGGFHRTAAVGRLGTGQTKDLREGCCRTKGAPMTQAPRYVYWLIAFGVAAVSTSAIFVKLSATPPVVLAFYRVLFAWLLLAPVLFARERDALRRTPGRDAALALLSGVFLALHYVVWFFSLRLTSVASSTVLVTTQPIWVMLIAYVLWRER